MTESTNATIATVKDTPPHYRIRGWGHVPDIRVGLPCVVGDIWWWTTHPYNRFTLGNGLVQWEVWKGITLVPGLMGIERKML